MEIKENTSRFQYVKTICPYIVYYDHSGSCIAPFIVIKCKDFHQHNFQLCSTKDLIDLHARLFTSLEEAEQISALNIKKRRKRNEPKYIIRK